MTNFAWFISTLGGFVSFVLVSALWVWMRPGSRAARRFLLFIALAYGIASLYSVSYLSSRLLVADLRPLRASDVPPGATAVVVLGTGSFTAKDWDENRFTMVEPVAAARVLEAVRIFGLVHPEWIISSGGDMRPGREREASGATMRDALVTLGVPASRIIIETESKNTHDEAVIVAPILASLHVDHVILVTSQLHMRRAIGVFRASGVSVIPAIARDPFAAAPWSDWLLPDNLGLQQTSWVLHEMLGLAYYAARGWYRF